MGGYFPELREHMLSNGIVPPEHFERTGEIQRWNTDGRKGKENGWCVIFPDGLGAQYGDWSLSEDGYNWQARSHSAMSSKDKEELRRQVERARAKRDVERELVQKKAAEKCRELWSKAGSVHVDHSYLKSKGIPAYGLHQLREQLLVPLRIDGELVNLQFISPDGKKRFKTGGRKKSAYHAIGKPINQILVICEGYATGASIHQATGHAVAIAFDAGNLLPVSKSLRAKHPEFRIIFAADDDRWTDE
ncbi:MAG: toprim domain-containing protein [gamma proteobacterium endosymbiont of Lamellibrachia anaximandri]|nr:toprim domain-containing protein [gamma proteobacterium endosymbiont of Lamellibrachia anaximandri]